MDLKVFGMFLSITIITVGDAKLIPTLANLSGWLLGLLFVLFIWNFHHHCKQALLKIMNSMTKWPITGFL